MPISVRNPTSIPIPVVATNGNKEYSVTLLPRQLIYLKPGYKVSDKTKSHFPKLVIVEPVADKVAPIPVIKNEEPVVITPSVESSAPETETIKSDPKVSNENEPSKSERPELKLNRREEKSDRHSNRDGRR